MNHTAISQILIAIIGLATAILSNLGSRSRTKALREDLLKETEAWQKVPQKSPVYEQLEQLIINDLDRINLEEKKTRQPTGIAVAVGFIVVSVSLGVPSIFGRISLSWLVVAVVFLVLGLVGLAQDGTRQRRDDKGNPQKER